MADETKPRIEPYARVEQPIRKRRIFFNNFLGGIAWGIGATLGLGVVLGVMGIIVTTIDVVPIVGDFVSDVYNWVIESNPNL